MTAALDLVLDPAPAPAPGEASLFPAGGEWARALAGLRAAGRQPGPEILLDLYAYELVERVREVVAAKPEVRRVVAPFWPLAAYEAAGIAAHPGRELARMLPAFREVRCVLRPEAAFANAMAPLGEPPFEASRYVAALEAAAGREEWSLTAALGAGSSPRLAHVRAGGAPARQTASALLVRGGRVLLERRSPEARSHQGLLDTPGGHVEPGEAPLECLRRELSEELDLTGVRARLVACQEDVDPASGSRYVHHVHVVESFEGDPVAREGQALEWWDLTALTAADEPETLNPLVAWLVREGLARRWFGRPESAC